MMFDKIKIYIEGTIMKITFKDKSYCEIRKSDEVGKILLIISAKDAGNTSKITNAVEITIEEFKQLISDIQL